MGSLGQVAMTSCLECASGNSSQALIARCVGATGILFCFSSEASVYHSAQVLVLSQVAHDGTRRKSQLVSQDHLYRSAAPLPGEPIRHARGAATVYVAGGDTCTFPLPPLPPAGLRACPVGRWRVAGGGGPGHRASRTEQRLPGGALPAYRGGSGHRGGGPPRDLWGCVPEEDQPRTPHLGESHRQGRGAWCHSLAFPSTQYIAIVFFIFLAEIAGGILAYVYRAQARAFVVDGLNSTIAEYFDQEGATANVVTTAVNQIQQQVRVSRAGCHSPGASDSRCPSPFAV